MQRAGRDDSESVIEHFRYEHVGLGPDVYVGVVVGFYPRVGRALGVNDARPYNLGVTGSFESRRVVGGKARSADVVVEPYPQYDLSSADNPVVGLLEIIREVVAHRPERIDADTPQVTHPWPRH